MYDDYKIYGPYQAKDGRLRLLVVDSSNIGHTISYPKYLMEMYLGRYLEKNEEVDHIDGNPLNNDLSNLQIKLHGEHQHLDVNRNRDITVYCTYCGKPFVVKGNAVNYRNRKDRHQSGYFCSRECSGKYGRDIQLGILNHNIVPKVIPEKYKLKYEQNDNTKDDTD